jgi:hypothetical protein
LRGDEAARAIQLHMVYAPEPPFDSGTPETATARAEHHLPTARLFGENRGRIGEPANGRTRK